MQIDILSRHPSKKATSKGNIHGMKVDILYTCDHYLVVKPLNGCLGRYLKLNMDTSISTYICDPSWTSNYERILSMYPCIMKETKIPIYLYWQKIST